MNNDEQFKNFIKKEASLDSQESKAELESIKSFIERKNMFPNPLLPFLLASSLLLILTLGISYKKINKSSHIETTVETAEEFLFNSYFAIEDDVESEDTDDDYLGFPI